jgi:signal peptidase I
MMSEELALNPGGEHAEAAPDEAPSDTRRRTDWKAELKGIGWLILAVLGFHSFIAKPFYIPSESMLPGLLVGDQLVVNKFAYGWSFVSPTIPNPVAIFRSLVLRQDVDSWGIQLPHVSGRLFGSLPQRGDVVIVTPPGKNTDYIKRVIGLPGDRLQVVNGAVILNGKPVQRGPIHYVDIPHYGGVVMPQEGNRPTCDPNDYGPDTSMRSKDGQLYCHLPIVTETLPGGRRYDTVELGPSDGDNYGPITISPDHVFLMGDNRDRSADSRFPLSANGLGDAVPWENIGGRAEFITYSRAGDGNWSPLTWFRGRRAGTSLHPVQAP